MTFCIILAVLLWIVCAEVNWALLKRMKLDAVKRGEGGHCWFLLAPIWLILLIIQYRFWQKQNYLEAVMDDIKFHRALDEIEEDDRRRRKEIHERNMLERGMLERGAEKDRD